MTNLNLSKWCLLILLKLIISHSITAQKVEIWGVTTHTGDDGGGMIFRTNPTDKSIITEYSFKVENIGAHPSHTKLTMASDGKLYGFTYSGGSHDDGVLFNYDPTTSVYTRLIDFGRYTNGASPRGELIEIENTLYGTTESGGKRGAGVIFTYDISTGVFQTIIDLDDYSLFGSRFGLTKGENNTLFGTAKNITETLIDILYSVDITNNEITILHEFNSETDGSTPSELILASNGKLYGTTLFEGELGFGSVYSYDPIDDSYEVIYSFDGEINGSAPRGAPCELNGVLYGLTSSGGGMPLG